MTTLDLRQQTNARPAPILLIERAQALMALLDEAVASHQLTTEQAQTMYDQWVNAQN